MPQDLKSQLHYLLSVILYSNLWDPICHCLHFSLLMEKIKRIQENYYFCKYLFHLGSLLNY